MKSQGSVARKRYKAMDHRAAPLEDPDESQFRFDGFCSAPEPHGETAVLAGIA